MVRLVERSVCKSCKFVTASCYSCCAHAFRVYSRLRTYFTRHKTIFYLFIIMLIYYYYYYFFFTLGSIDPEG